WAVAAARWCRGRVRLQDTDRVSEIGSRSRFSRFCVPTDADTNNGPILSCGWGCDAIKTWARALPGTAQRSRSARNEMAISKARRVISGAMLAPGERKNNGQRP